MRKNDLENKIRASFDAETPDLRERIEESCRTTVQEPATDSEQGTGRLVLLPVLPRRVIAAVLSIALFLCGVLVGRIGKGGTDGVIAPASADSFVYIDVNPSIEISVNSSNMVVECIGANEDATKILADLSLEGVELNTAISAVVGAMYVNGYLTDTTNSILVSVDAPNEERTETLLGDITDKINSFFGDSPLECSIIAQSVTVSEELKKRADENGVSVGKMHLVDKMLDGIDELGVENASELAGMSIQELNLIYSSHKGKDENGKFGKDTVTGNAGGYLTEDELGSIVAAHLLVDTGSIEGIDVKARFDGEGGERRLVYVASVRLVGNLVYIIKMDCTSGEVISSELAVEDILPGGQGDTHDTPDGSIDSESPSDTEPPEDYVDGKVH